MTTASTDPFKLVRLDLYRSYDSEKFRLNASFEGYGNNIKMQVGGEVGEKILELLRDDLAEELQRAFSDSIQHLIGIPTEYKALDNDGNQE